MCIAVKTFIGTKPRLVNNGVNVIMSVQLSCYVYSTCIDCVGGVSH